MGGRIFVRSALALALVAVQACAAAPLVLLAANAGMLGFVGYKTYQSQSGGEVDIGFENDTLGQGIQAEIGSAGSIAFWPTSNRSLTTAAERIGAQLGFDTVVPPATASALIEDIGAPVDLATMTVSERQNAFASLAAEADVELVLALADAGAEANLSTFTFSRQTATRKFEVYLYDRSQEALLWTSQLSATVPVSTRVVNEAEVYDIIGQALVDRLTDFVAGRLQPEQSDS